MNLHGCHDFGHGQFDGRLVDSMQTNSDPELVKLIIDMDLMDGSCLHFAPRWAR